MNRSHSLNQLQNIDTQLAAKRDLLRKIQVKRADESRLTAARGDLESASGARATLESKLLDSDLLARSLEAQAKSVGDKLYGGRVSNPKELAGLEQDAEMLKRQRSELDDSMLELMAQLEASQASERERQGLVEGLENEQARNVAKFDREIAELDKQIVDLTRQREEWAGKISTEDLRLYEELARTHGGRAVSQMKGSTCTACGVDVPTGVRSRALAGEELALCTNCGRILAS